MIKIGKNNVCGVKKLAGVKWSEDLSLKTKEWW